MSDVRQDDRGALIRALRQQLESLQRAGLDWVPVLSSVSPFSPPTAQTARPVPGPSRPLPVVPPEPTPPQKTAPLVPEVGVTGVRPAAAPSLFDDPETNPLVVPPGERSALLATLAEEVAACTRCPLLATTRTQTVFGAGSPTARLLFVGEAPGAEEDRTGFPFVGPAGALLTDMITKGMGLSRDEVYIANVLKSRPPGNRNPLPDEVANCLPFLERQIAIVAPEFLCLLGKVAASALLATALPLGKLRGRWHRYRDVPTLVTYHPSFLLRNPASKKDAWDDLQMLMKAMGLTPPGRNKS